MKYKLAKGWTKGRYRELLELRKLLQEVWSLERANNHIDRTRRCIKAAEKLQETRRVPLRPSFLAFLESLAVVEVPGE